MRRRNQGRVEEDGKPSSDREVASPPRWARAVLYRVLPAEVRDDAVAELDDKFQEYAAAYGDSAWPRRWYRRQVLGALHPRWWARDKNVARVEGPRNGRNKATMISDWGHDLRFGLRMLGKTPGMTAVIVITLAMGIGFNGAVFSLANTIILNDIPVERPDRLAFIQSTRLSEGQDDLRVSRPDYRHFTANARSFEALGAYTPVSLNLGDEVDAPQRLVGSWVTPSLFDALGVEPVIGRRFTEAETAPDTTNVALLGYGLWQTRYGGDEDIVGAVIRLSGRPYTVVGVLPEFLDQTPFYASVWTPLTRDEEAESRRDQRRLYPVGRLADGVTHGEADREIKQLAALLAKEWPESNEGVGAVVRDYRTRFTEDSNAVITLILLGAVGLLLLIACANVANLLISRAVDRVNEVGIRSALGASRSRVVRQLLVESLLLSIVGGLAAMAIAWWGARGLESAIMLANPPEYWDFSVRPSVYAFIGLLSVATALIFGLTPALHATRTDAAAVLRESGRGSQSGGTRRLTGALVVVQLALAVVLLTSAGVMIRSTRNVLGIEWAIAPEGVVTVAVGLPSADYPEREQIVAFHQSLRDRLAEKSGIDAYAVASSLPGDGGYTVITEIEDMAMAPGDPGQLLQQVIVGPGYFEMAGAQPLRGRLFDSSDVYDGRMVVVVEERLADHYWPGEDPIGKRLRWLDQEETRWLTVVGVVPDLAQAPSLEVAEDHPVVYTPYAQEPLRNIRILVRSQMAPEAVARLLREEVQELDPNLPLYDIRSLQAALDQRTTGFRIVSVLFFLLGGIALFLSCIGIYAVMAFAVSRRQQEIGIRMALGAQRGEVLRLVLRRALVQTTSGLAIGLLLALAATRTLGMFLYEVSPNDPLVFAITVVALVGTALLASLVPANRAGRVDPLAALRTS